MLPTNTQQTNRGWLTDFIILAALLTLFYLFWLGKYPLFTPDEGRYTEVAREMLAAGDFITPRLNGIAFLDKPALYYWLQATAMYLFGVNEWAARLFPALLAVLGCLITYICGRMLFDRRTGIISAIVLATSPLFFGNGHYADLNMEVAVFISGTLLFFLTGVMRHDKWRGLFLFAAYLFAACAFLTKGMIGLAFPCMIIGSWIVLSWRWRELTSIYLIRGMLLFIALVLPWYLLVQKANPAFFHYFFVVQQVTRFLSAGTFNNPSPYWFYIPIILIGIFPWTIFLVQAFFIHIKNYFRSPHTHAKELYLLLWFFIVLTFFSIPQTKTVGYILPVFPPLALLIGNYLSIMWNNSQSKSIYFAIINFVILSSVLAALLITLPQTEWIKIATTFKPLLLSMGLIFIVSAIMAVIFIKRKNLLALFSITTISSIIFLLFLIMNAQYLNDNSAKPLVTQLKTVIQPQDEVVSYLRFYQDVPLYLGRRISIAANWNAPDILMQDNWQRELWYGMTLQKTDDILINEESFWKKWNSNKRIFAFINSHDLNHFEAQKKPYFVLGQHNNIVLLSNHN